MEERRKWFSHVTEVKGTQNVNMLKLDYKMGRVSIFEKRAF